VHQQIVAGEEELDYAVSKNPSARATSTVARSATLPDDHLLDSAHIMADAHDLLGQPVIANGIALPRSTTRRSKIA